VRNVGLSSAEARILVDLAERARLTIMVGHVLLFHPAFQKIKEIIDSGRIGKLQYLYSNRLNLGTVRKQENILWSFAPHDVAIFQYLVGASPIEVVSRGGAFVQPTVHDSSMTILSYPNNVVGHIFVNWLHPFKEHRIVVIGNKGMLSYEDSANNKQLLLYQKGIELVDGEPSTRDGATEVVPFSSLPPLEIELTEFISRVRRSASNEQAGVASGLSAIEVLEILEAATIGLINNPQMKVDEGVATMQTHNHKEVFVHPTSIIDDDVVIGAGTKIWHFSHIQSGARIGSRCSLGQNVNVASGVRIGNQVKIQNNVSVYEGVELEDYVFCGPSMVFTNVLVPRSQFPQRGAEFYQKTLVKQGASIGANATIVCGHTIGCSALVGSGAVVTKDESDYALVVGNPAHRIGWVCVCGSRLPEEFQQTVCSQCSRSYVGTTPYDRATMTIRLIS